LGISRRELEHDPDDLPRPSFGNLRSPAQWMALIPNLDWTLSDNEVLRQPGAGFLAMSEKYYTATLQESISVVPPEFLGSVSSFDYLIFVPLDGRCVREGLAELPTSGSYVSI
jgi:hypothetical protein